MRVHIDQHTNNDLDGAFPHDWLKVKDTGAVSVTGPSLFASTAGAPPAAQHSRLRHHQKPNVALSCPPRCPPVLVTCRRMPMRYVSTKWKA